MNARGTIYPEHLIAQATEDSFLHIEKATISVAFNLSMGRGYSKSPEGFQAHALRVQDILGRKANLHCIQKILMNYINESEVRMTNLLLFSKLLLTACNSSR